MSSVCILTDSTAQFAKPVFPGRNLVSIIPLQVQVEGGSFTNGKDLKVNSLPTIGPKWTGTPTGASLNR